MSELEAGRTGEPTRVRFAISYLKNLGNFENVKIDVEIEDNRLPGESVDQACQRVWSKVDEQLSKRIKQVIADAPGRE